MLQAERKKYLVFPLGLRQKRWQVKKKTLLLIAEDSKGGSKQSFEQRQTKRNQLIGQQRNSDHEFLGNCSHHLYHCAHPIPYSSCLSPQFWIKISSPFSTTSALLLTQLSYDFSCLLLENNLNTFVLELKSQKYVEIPLQTACNSSEQTCCLARHLSFCLIYKHKLTIHTL